MVVTRRISTPRPTTECGATELPSRWRRQCDGAECRTDSGGEARVGLSTPWRRDRFQESHPLSTHWRSRASSAWLSSSSSRVGSRLTDEGDRCGHVRFVFSRPCPVNRVRGRDVSPRPQPALAVRQIRVSDHDRRWSLVSSESYSLIGQKEKGSPGLPSEASRQSQSHQEKCRLTALADSWKSAVRCHTLQRSSCAKFPASKH